MVCSLPFDNNKVKKKKTKQNIKKRHRQYYIRVCVHSVTPNLLLYFFPCWVVFSAEDSLFILRNQMRQFRFLYRMNRMLFYTQYTRMDMDNRRTHTRTAREHTTFVAKRKKKERRFACFYRELTSHVLKNCGQCAFDCHTVSLHLIFVLQSSCDGGALRWHTVLITLRK